ncbi:MAG: alternative ribosome rescue aminoacyl-tRNA hydrolase ArfB [Planctomycetota bacterium]|jgi:ribosome-associated protein
MEDLIVTHYLTIPASELQAVYSRSGGPGGQNVNKVNTKATLIWDLNQTQALYPTTLTRLQALAASRITDEGLLKIHCQVHREQPRNLQACRDLLRGLVLEALKPVVVRKETRPSAGARRRRLSDKKLTGEKKRGRNERWE